MILQSDRRVNVAGITIVLGVLAMVCVAFAGTSGHGRRARFEYKVLSQMKIAQKIMAQAPPQQSQSGNKLSNMLEAMQDHAKATENVLTELGKDGWELVSVNEAFYILKRVAQ